MVSFRWKHQEVIQECVSITVLNNINLIRLDFSALRFASTARPFSYPELRSSWPAPRIESSGRLQFSVRDSRTSDLSAQSRAFIKMVDQAINFGQEIQNFSDITLKEKQYEVLKLLVVEEKDVLAVLPTGYGKSLIYYLLPPVWNFMNCGGISNAQHSSVLFISPLNALIQD